MPLLKIAEPAGLILIADNSPPKAPKAPDIAENLADPSTLSFEYLNASKIFWETINSDPKIKIRERKNLFIFFKLIC